jgi:hypothetical protein
MLVAPTLRTQTFHSIARVPQLAAGCRVFSQGSPHLSIACPAAYLLAASAAHLSRAVGMQADAGPI